MNPDAFRKLALDEIDAVYRLAYSLAPTRDRADDFVQETYLRAFRSKTDFRLNDFGVRPYLFKILHNVVHSAATRDARQPRLLEDGVDAVDVRRDETVDQCTEIDQLQWDQVDERLKLAILALPLAHRTVFLLCAVENLRYREIAEVVGVPLGTVMSRLHHARQLLFKYLAAFAEERRLVGRPVRQDKVD